MVNVTKKENLSIFKKVVVDTKDSGEVKLQFTVDLNSYDTSKMEGYVEGRPVYRGYTVALRTLKPSKEHSKQAIHFDPSNKEIRQAIFDMYSAFDSLSK